MLAFSKQNKSFYYMSNPVQALSQQLSDLDQNHKAQVHTTAVI